MNSFNTGIHSSVWVTYYKPVNVNSRYPWNNRLHVLLNIFQIQIRLIDNVHNICFVDHDLSRSPHTVLPLSFVCACFINDK